MKNVLTGLGIFLPPIAWFANLEANFALAPLACGSHGKITLLLVSLIAFIVAITAGLVAWTNRDEDQRLGLGGAMIGALCAIVIAAQSIPTFVLEGCE